LDEWIQAVILGIVEGITEFLPVSSTAHLLVSKNLLNASSLSGEWFIVAIQLGAVLAIILNHGKELVALFRFTETNQRFWLALFISVSPAFLVGIAIGGQIHWLYGEHHQAMLIAIALISGGLIMLFVETRIPPPQSVPLADLPQISKINALFIGICQVFAFIPGVSRSAASIVAGMLVGMNRQAATKFSFFLAIPTILGAATYTMVFHVDQLSSSQLDEFFIGLLVSIAVAFLTIRWLLNYLATHRFTLFAGYRIAAGSLLLLLHGNGIL